MKEIAHDKEEAIPKPGNYKFPVMYQEDFWTAP